MALLFKEKPVLVDGNDAMEEIEVPKMDTAIQMSLLDESHCEEYYNEEQIRMANTGSCSVEGDIESNDCFEWTEMETVPSSPSDDMNWYLEDHVEGISMDELVQFGNDFDFNCYEIPFENGCASSLWQEIYDTATYN
ncbi:hypothetical protein E1A91_A01G041300v1 [Gossypium mustelinum]|uniref:Uncharacterized protein n=1 Tax=Gossypium mustelinum TaxID=34275 RepID=A0A5D3AB57_GOSMU|nr:hypothetical protein E1A91_A01G041300v1 [Gossypium mustelinum]